MASSLYDAAFGQPQLPNGWLWHWLDEVMDIRGGAQPEASTFISEPRPGYIRFVQIRDFETDGHVTYIEDSNKWRKCLKSDILIARYGASLGRILRGIEGAYNVALVKAEPTNIEKPFLYYLLRSNFFQGPIMRSGARSAQAGFNKRDLGVIPVPVPPKGEQRAIASILGALDDKIELNRRMSATLEAIARALFKSWFVDFDPVRAKAEGRDPALPTEIATLFPDSWSVGSASSVPAGWETNGLDDIAIFLNGLALQKFPPKDGAATLPVIKIAQLRAGHSSGADRASTNVPRDYVIGSGDILFSWSGSLECHIWTGGPGALNQHLFKVSGTRVPSWFAYLAVHEHLAEFRHIAAGKATTMGHIQRHHLHEAKITVPPLGLIEAANSIIGPMIEASWTRRLQCSTLAALRDALLPKLISGELRVCDEERVLAASA